MQLKVILPARLLLEREVSKVIAEAVNGSFCLLPRHLDMVAALVPGILAFIPVGGEEEFLAVDEGILVKCGSEVLVSTQNAVWGPPLGELKQAVEKQFRLLGEREQKSRRALNRLEASLVRGVLELGGGGHG